jgi:formylglycine-generating enzyme required for sulfatase activity
MPTTVPARPGERVHVVVAHNDRGLVLYINGKEHARKSYAQINVPPKLLWEGMLKQPMLVGGGRNPDGARANFWPGTIDELRISKRTSKSRYEGNFTPKDRFELDADTLALYHFEEGQGTVLKDSSPNKRDAKIVGASWVLPNSPPPAIEPDEPSPPAAPAKPEPAIPPFDAAEAVVQQRAWAKYLGREVESPNSVGMKMVVIPPGRFTMGRSPRDAEVFAPEKLPDDDLPTHSVTLTKPFAIAATEVTQKQWREVMGTTPWVGKQQIGGSDDCPATYVSWKDAREFCKRLSEKENAEYRLPTEAEWEWACRAGTETSFSFGEDVKELHDHAWARNNAQDQPHPVAQKKPNPWGLFDMHGNAWEWTEDIYGPYSAEAAVDPRSGPGTPQAKRTLRGGCFWSVPTSDYRSAARRSWPETLGYSESGFRPILVLPEPPVPISLLPSQLGESSFALQFDGATSHVEVPDIGLDISQPFTVEVWAWCDPTIHNQYILSTSGAALRLAREGKCVFYVVQDPGIGTLSDMPLPPRQWVHLAGVSDGAEHRLYVNGKRQQMSQPHHASASRAASGLLGASRRTEGLAEFFQGQIRGVRISKAARYAGDFAPPPRLASDADTLVLYDFDEDAGETLKDASGRRRDGKIVGAKWVETSPPKP